MCDNCFCAFVCVANIACCESDFLPIGLSKELVRYVHMRMLAATSVTDVES